MTERFEKLEAELAAMKPREMPAEVFDAITSQLSDAQPRNWADRCLIGAMSLGSLAACMIVAMLLMQSPAPGPQNISVTRVPSDTTRMGDASQMLARADVRLGELLK